jgi:hypothetical protein
MQTETEMHPSLMVRPLQDTNPNGFVSGSKSKPLRGLLKRDKTLGFYAGAGWSSPVARQAHNLKAAGSNPAPATTDTCKFSHSGYFLTSSSA